MKKIKVGVIGTGGIARAAHLPSLKKQPNVDIVGICDIDETALRCAGEQFGIDRWFDDHKKMLEMEEMEAVHVCTPNDAHSFIAINALNAGKHVLVEKPIARNPTEAEGMVQAAERSGKKLMVAQCVRFSSESETLKRFIDAGDLGEIYFARVWALRRRGIPNWGVFTNKEKQGGGPLVDIGVHSIDQALFLMGHPTPITVSGHAFTKIGNTPGHVGAFGSWDHTKYTVEDYAAGFVRFSNGACMTIESSFAANIAQDTMSTSIMGTLGGAQTGPLKIFSEKNGALIDITPVGVPEQDIYATEIRAFYECIERDTEPPVTGRQGLNVMKIIDGIYRSGETGREVVL